MISERFDCWREKHNRLKKMDEIRVLNIDDHKEMIESVPRVLQNG